VRLAVGPVRILRGPQLLPQFADPPFVVRDEIETRSTVLWRFVIRFAHECNLVMIQKLIEVQDCSP